MRCLPIESAATVFHVAIDCFVTVHIPNVERVVHALVYQIAIFVCFQLFETHILGTVVWWQLN